jgi:hypothetical protein
MNTLNKGNRMSETPSCIYCDQSSDVTPLILLTYQGGDLYICPQHLPILIHEPAKLAGKLPGVENLIPPKGHGGED